MDLLHAGRIRKTITAAVGSIILWAQVAWVPDGHITRPEWIGLAIALATALGVYGVSNAPSEAEAAADDDGGAHIGPVPDLIGEGA